MVEETSKEERNNILLVSTKRHHLVHLGPVLLVDLLLDAGDDLLLGPVEGAAVGVVDDGYFVEAEDAVEDGDVAEGVAGVAACVAVDYYFWWGSVFVFFLLFC